MNAFKTVLTILVVSTLFLGGCLATRIDGGKLSYKSPAGVVISQKQSEDPKNASTLNHENDRTETVILPAGSLLMTGTNFVKLSSNAVYTITTHEKVTNVQGAAQKNTLAEVAAKLSSLKWLTYFGVILFLFGLATAVYPPLKIIVGGSLTTSATIAGGGLFLTFAPVLIVGHELLILGGVIVAIGLYFFAHRHGSLSGELKALKEDLFDPTTVTTNVSGSQG